MAMDFDRVQKGERGRREKCRKHQMVEVIPAHLTSTHTNKMDHYPWLQRY